MRRLLGYADEISVEPGEEIEFKVSSEDEGNFDLEIVRIRCGDDTPEGPGLKLYPVDAEVNGSYPARYQWTQVGSMVCFDKLPSLALKEFTLQAMIWPTLHKKEVQTVMGTWREDKRTGFALTVEDGMATIRFGDGKDVFCLSTGTPMHERRWYLVVATLDCEAGTVFISQSPKVRYAGDYDADERYKTTRISPVVGGPFRIAAHNRDRAGRTVATGHFNGKIDSPALSRRALADFEIEQLKHRYVPDDLKTDLVALWDFSKEMSGTTAYDIGPYGTHGEIVNMPTRAMKGWNHDGTEMNWTRRPDHYGAIHFHEDDLYDCKWETDAHWTIPESIRSGFYCARLSQNDQQFYIPFYVRPSVHKPRARVALLVATCSYYAYANNHMGFDWGTLGEHSSNGFTVWDMDDVHLHMHPEHGLSMYDNHSDGSGVAYASRLRPFLHMGPCAVLWQYNADTHITDWLEEKEIAYDVITDDDLHEGGLTLLENYTCVMTTTHPEYTTTSMMRSLLAYQQGGGRFIYLGGNGFYWRVALHDTLPGVMEMRRAEDGMRSWIADGGEYYMSFNGELGGLWRRNGMAPETICGTGFSAQGFNFSSYYKRTDASEDPRASWIFEGIGRDEKIGDFGTVFGGAAGSEIDSIDHEAGTPPHALVVARADDFGVDFHWVNEEFHHSHSAVNGENCPFVVCDMVYYEMPFGGAVFSVSSIAFAGSLAHNNYNNNVSRLLENVVTRFADPESIPGPHEIRSQRDSA